MIRISERMRCEESNLSLKFFYAHCTLKGWQADLELKLEAGNFAFFGMSGGYGVLEDKVYFSPKV